MNKNSDYTVFWELIVRILNDQADEAEKKQFNEILVSDRALLNDYLYLKKNWEQVKNLKNIDKIDAEGDWKTVLERISSRSENTYPIPTIQTKRSPAIKILPYAAAVMLIFVISYFFIRHYVEPTEYQPLLTKIEAPAGSRTNVDLPDGTNVWLNAGSILTYDSGFGQKNRNVFLNGEAYFDVEPFKDLAFTVNTGDVDIKVLGTRFNVMSYPDDDIVETSLISGKLEISVIHDTIVFSPVTLNPKQRITYLRDENVINVKEEEKIDEFTAWKYGRLVFRSESLKNIARKLERFYNVEILFIDDSIQELTFTGTLDDITIEEVMEAIAGVSAINYRIENKKIFLSI